MNKASKIFGSSASGLCITMCAMAFAVSGCSVVAPIATEAVGGKVIDFVGSLNDKPLTVSDKVKEIKNLSIEKEKWRQITNNEINLVFVVQSSKPCKLGIFAKGSVYMGDYVVEHWLFQRLGGTEANTKYAANEKVYLRREKGFASKVTLDSVECT